MDAAQRVKVQEVQGVQVATPAADQGRLIFVAAIACPARRQIPVQINSVGTRHGRGTTQRRLDLSLPVWSAGARSGYGLYSFNDFLTIQLDFSIFLT